jgi:hypothetical protein
VGWVEVEVKVVVAVVEEVVEVAEEVVVKVVEEAPALRAAKGLRRADEALRQLCPPWW